MEFSWEIRIYRGQVSTIKDESISVHMEHMRVIAKCGDIPNRGIVGANFETEHCYSRSSR